jgi:23S rRNA (guanosine2251-2'-O)-methyltransferase
MSDQIEGRNAVREALKSKRNINQVFILASGNDQILREIREAAGSLRIPIKLVERRQLDQMARTDRHQGVIAIIPEYQYHTLDHLLSIGSATAAPLVVLLDGIEDPHNLGSILRSAEVFGATGVIIPKHRAAGVTPTVIKVASGAIEHIPVVQTTNMTETIKQMKKAGYWIAGGEGESSVSVMDQNLTGPLGLVIGSEGKGISRLVREQCDYLVSIPMTGQTGSLNASVAAGVLLYEISRQRNRAENRSERTGDHA